MQYTELMSELASRLQLSGLSPLGERCALRFDDVVVHFTHQPTLRAVDLYAPLGHADMGRPGMLDALGQVREHTSLFHWDEHGALSLRQRFHLQAMVFPPFFKAIERFINLADHWRQQFATGKVPVA